MNVQNIGVDHCTVDLRSAVKPPPALTPISMVARAILSSGPSVQAVLIIDQDGKALAHERALNYASESDSDDESAVTYFARDSGIIYYLRTSKGSDALDVRAQVESIIRSPFPLLTE